MQDHLGPTVIAPVEMLVGVRRLVQLQFMRHDERRISAAGVDQVDRAARARAVFDVGGNLTEPVVRGRAGGGAERA